MPSVHGCGALERLRGVDGDWSVKSAELLSDITSAAARSPPGFFGGCCAHEPGATAGDSLDLHRCGSRSSPDQSWARRNSSDSCPRVCRCCQEESPPDSFNLSMADTRYLLLRSDAMPRVPCVRAEIGLEHPRLGQPASERRPGQTGKGRMACNNVRFTTRTLIPLTIGGKGLPHSHRIRFTSSASESQECSLTAPFNNLRHQEREADSSRTGRFIRETESGKDLYHVRPSFAIVSA